MTYQDLKKERQDLYTIAKVISENFDELLQDIALNKQWKVAGDLKIQPAYLSVIITTIKATKGL